MPVLLFHSKSKDLKARVLSNFSNHSVNFEGRQYPSIEHAFQAQKYLYSNKPQEINAFTSSGELGQLDPKFAKSAGSKTGMMKRGAMLDDISWNSNSISVMKSLIEIKIKTHEEVARVLEEAKKLDQELVHYSLRDMKWGCHYDHDLGKIKRGDNLLGKIYTDLVNKIDFS